MIVLLALLGAVSLTSAVIGLMALIGVGLDYLLGDDQ